VCPTVDALYASCCISEQSSECDTVRSVVDCFFAVCASPHLVVVLLQLHVPAPALWLHCCQVLGVERLHSISKVPADTKVAV
jgi:hypothetical protein